MKSGRYFLTFKELWNRFQGIDSACLYVAWRASTTTRFLLDSVPPDCSKIPARKSDARKRRGELRREDENEVLGDESVSPGERIPSH